MKSLLLLAGMLVLSGFVTGYFVGHENAMVIHAYLPAGDYRYSPQFPPLIQLNDSHYVKIRRNEKSFIVDCLFMSEAGIHPNYGNPLCWPLEKRIILQGNVIENTWDQQADQP